MTRTIEIPHRTSSKHALEEIDQWSKTRKDMDDEIERATKKLKSSGSFDALFWEGRSLISQQRAQQTSLTHKISKARFLESGEGDEEAWSKHDQATHLIEQEARHKAESEVYQKQAAKLKLTPADTDKARRRFFMRLFTTSTRGLNISVKKTGSGRRDPTTQSEFRKALISACNSKHKDPLYEVLWCPLLGLWVPHKDVHAAHIFPKSAGQDDMDEIFGREKQDHPELDSIENGLMLCDDAERMIEDGKLLIVPNVPDNAQTAEMEEWLNSNPKSYKIRVLEPESKDMQKYYLHQVAEPMKKWRDLDGVEMQFLSDHRPRARYLYFQYCVTMLRRSWNAASKDGPAIKAELGKRYWGTRGPFMKKKMLLALVEEMGHEYENLMEGATPPDTAEDNQPDETALLVATQSIGATSKPKDPNEEEDEEEEEGEDQDDTEDE